ADPPGRLAPAHVSLAALPAAARQQRGAPVDQRQEPCGGAVGRDPRLRDHAAGPGQTAAGLEPPELRRHMSARAGIVVTGTEVLSGRVSDRNGPFLSDRLSELGVEHAFTLVVGDRAEDMEHALDFLAASGVDVIITSGGLGPTADDLTAEVVG